MTETTCHYCDENETEYTCWDCGEPTCEDCFVEMTQFHAGDPPPCKGCDMRRETARREEGLREYEAEKAEREKRDARNAQARARYRSPEAKAKRAAAKAERRKAELERRRKIGEELGNFMKGFARFF